MSPGWRAGRRCGLLPVVALLLTNLPTPLHGSHLFRQAHIAANIETYIQDGISLRPRTYNRDVPQALYDCPIEEMAIAGVCRSTGFDPLIVARVLSLLCVLVMFLVLSRLLTRLRVPDFTRTLTLALFAYAPLNLFYFQTPLVDVMAETAALGSLLAFVVWNDSPRAPLFVLMAATAVLAALIKSPVELPVFVAAIWHRMRTRGLRGLGSRDVVAYVLAVGGAVLGFKVLANQVNGATELISPWEEGQYFGPPEERLSLDAWAAVLRTLGLLILNPLTLVLAIGGAGAWFARSRSRRRSVLGGLALGSALTVLVFLNRFRVHNYYLLPLVVPAAFFAAHGVQFARVLLRARRRSGRSWPTGRAAALAGLATALTLGFAWHGYAELATPDPTKQLRGEWVRERTTADDYVLWVVGGEDANWNPTFLYFAKRDGENLNRSHLDRETLAALDHRFVRPHRRVLLFCADRESADRVEAMGAHPVATEKARRLYLLEPSWLSSSP